MESRAGTTLRQRCRVQKVLASPNGEVVTGVRYENGNGASETIGADLVVDASGRGALTNLLERLFVEERRRLKIIPNAFGERAVLKLMFGALIRAAERWRSLKITEFERRQLTAARKELDQEYETQIGLKHKLSKETTSAKISSTLRT